MTRLLRLCLCWTPLLVVAVIGGWPAGPALAAPRATIADCSFSPVAGGPGTLVQAQVAFWFSAKPGVSVGFAVRKTPAELQGQQVYPDSDAAFKPLGPPLATIPVVQGFGAVTFAVPARLASGLPIPTTGLYLACEDGGQVFMGGGQGAVPFTFLPAPLPRTGSPGPRPWLALALCGLAGVILGMLCTRVGRAPPRAPRPAR